jgi:ABC-2 type transport system permease protein
VRSVSKVTAIARDELRLMARNRVAMIAFALLIVLTLAAVLASWSQRRAVAQLRERQQQTALAAFDAQPDRHPHRMVHYGTFIYRPHGPLAAFDPGVDAFTGSSMFLEGHRQNTANFGDVQQGSLLIRFGQLTPAFVLQAVAPLLLIFLGFGALSRETERGTLGLLLLHGATRGQVVRGKLLALATVASLAAVPAMLGLAPIAAQPDAPVLPMLAIALGYLGYLALCVLSIVLVSALVRHSRDALLALVALWLVTVVLLPRVAPDVAAAAVPLRNRLQTEVAIARDLRALGDTHDPDDPHYAAFRQATLRRYGVTRIQDLPVNYKGVLALEGERLTSALFDRYAARNFAAQVRQIALVQTAGVLSPAIALRSLSMAAAGTDFAGHRRFLEQAEAYRYALVQRLNRMQADDVSYADDTALDAGADRRKRISGRNWQALPDFAYRAPREGALAMAAVPGLLILLAWLGVVAMLLARATRRLGDRR